MYYGLSGVGRLTTGILVAGIVPNHSPIDYVAHCSVHVHGYLIGYSDKEVNKVSMVSRRAVLVRIRCRGEGGQ